MHRFKNILYFADGLDEGASLQRAAELAEANDARLTVMDVIEENLLLASLSGRLGLDLQQVLIEQREAALGALLATLRSGDAPVLIQVRSGEPVVEVIRGVLRNGYDLVVKAARSPAGLSERLLGGTDLHLLRKCPCPVWIDRPEAARPYRSVLAAVDPASEEGALCARRILELARSLAHREGAALTVVHVWRMEGESMLRTGMAKLPEGEVDRLLEELRERHAETLQRVVEEAGINPGEATIQLFKGYPADVIQAVGKQIGADVMLLGTLGRQGMAGLIMGNTAEQLLRTTQAAVLAVKPEGFVSPITASP